MLKVGDSVDVDIAPEKGPRAATAALFINHSSPTSCLCPFSAILKNGAVAPKIWFGTRGLTTAKWARANGWQGEVIHFEMVDHIGDRFTHSPARRPPGLEISACLRF